MLRELAGAQTNLMPFHRRDSVDIARTALGRVANALLSRLICRASRGEWDDAESEAYVHLLEFLCRVLDSHPDYSQSRSLELLRAECPVNDSFEPALKKNLANSYSRGYASEFMRWLCVPENRLFLGWLRESAARKSPADTAGLMRAKEEAFRSYLDRPLREMQPDFTPLSSCELEDAARQLTAFPGGRNGEN